MYAMSTEVQEIEQRTAGTTMGSEKWGRGKGGLYGDNHVHRVAVTSLSGKGNHSEQGKTRGEWKNIDTRV